MVFAGGVGGEFSDEGGAAEDGDVVALAYDVADMSGPAQTDIDAVGRHVQLARGFTDGVAADENRCGQRPVSRAGFVGGSEGFSRGGSA